MNGNQTSGPTELLPLLKLMQLADSALPIGGEAHSFGLETLIAEKFVEPGGLADFLRDYLAETGLMDAVFCRAAHRFSTLADSSSRWIELNANLSARKPAHETRLASLTLGRRMIELFAALEGVNQPEGQAHHATAFGFIGGMLGVTEDLTAAAYLQQIVSGLVSACQRLAPLGQHQAARIVWNLKPAILDTLAESKAIDPGDAGAFTPLVDVASMRHVALTTRLFIS